MCWQRIACLSLGSALLLVGCGDSGRSVDFPVPDDTPVSELTVAEMQQICMQSIAEVQGASIELQCAVAGLSAKYTGDGTCEGVRSSCLESAASELADVEQQCAEIDEADRADLVGCDISSGEYERCVNAALALFDDFLGKLGCSADLAQLQGSTQFELPAECAVVEAKCPALGLTGDDTATSTR